MSQELSIIPTQANSAVSFYSNAEQFALGQRIATMLSQTTMIPKEYQGNVANCLVAVEMSNRMGIPAMMVMQNLHVIHGRPSWSSQFLIASLNTSGKFGPLRWKLTGEGDNHQCVAYATDKATGEVLEGPAVSIAMAKKEGWYSKTGSKWQTMPELMLRYRAATFFARLYAPEFAMGIMTADEVEDVDYVEVKPGRSQNFTPAAVDNLNEAIQTPSDIPQSVSVPKSSATSAISELNQTAQGENGDDEQLI